MGAVPVLSEDTQVLILEHFGEDRPSLCSLSRVCRDFYQLSLPLLYKRANLGALHTLLDCPDFAALVQSADLSWKGYDPYEYGPDSQDGPSRYGMDRPVELTDEQAELCQVSAEDRLALAACLPAHLASAKSRVSLLRALLPVRTALFLSMCPNLHHVNAAWYNSAAFFATYFPVRSDDSFCAEYLTSLELLSDSMLGVDGGLSASSVVRVMMLPRLAKLAITCVLELYSWKDDMKLAIPQLRGRSAVEHLVLHDTWIGLPSQLQDILHLPKALVSLEFQQTSGTLLDLSAFAKALVTSPSYPSLTHVSVSQTRSFDRFFDPSPQGDISQLIDLSALQSLKMDLDFIFGFISQGSSVEPKLECLPRVVQLGLTALHESCADHDVAVNVVHRVIHALGGRPLRILTLDKQERWDDDEALQLKQMGSEAGVSVIFE
jgi:hypothetical protein